MPQVSVVMPVRDGAAFVEAAVRSILVQTLGDIELVVIDDGSTDRTPEILSSLAARDARLRLVRTAPRGIVAALNAGLAAARSEIVARMDADDIALPERLDRQVAALAAAPHAAVIGTACRAIDAAGRPLHLMSFPTEAAEVRAALARGNCVAHPSVIMRRAAVQAAGAYRACFVQAEDYDLWLRLVETHDIVNLPEPLLHYRLHGFQSAWATLQRRFTAELAAQACAALRRAGCPEPPMPDGPADAAFLEAAGLTEREIAEGIAARAIFTAEEAVARGLAPAALSALRLGLRQPMGWRWRAAALRRVTRRLLPG